MHVGLCSFHAKSGIHVRSTLSDDLKSSEEEDEDEDEDESRSSSDSEDSEDYW